MSEGLLLSIRDLTIRYPAGREWRIAVDRLSLDLAPGEALGLVGESGAGKSSVGLAVMRGLPTHVRVDGRILFEGQDVLAMPLRSARRLRGGRIAYVPQNPGAALNPTLTIGRQISEVLEIHRGFDRRASHMAATEMFGRVRIPDPEAVLRLYPHQLSGGMQQRVLIATALVTGPSLLVLDEPTTALDTTVQAEILGIFRKVREEFGTSLLFVSHDLDVVAELCDRLVVMRQGEVVETGTVDAVFQASSHPYTRHLMAARPDVDAPTESRQGTAPLLDLKGVARSFGGTTVLRPTDLRIDQGEAFGLVGESGSGKTTLARIVAGLLAPSDGRATLQGDRLAATVSGRSAAQRRAIQMVFQSPQESLNPRRRVGTVLRRAVVRLAGLGRRAAREEAFRLLEEVRLPAQHAVAFPGRLSGGERQRVAIARAFAGQPRLVVLDEPTSALDVSVQATILDLLRRMREENDVAYLFISHDLPVVRSVCDRIGVMYRGEILEIGPADAVLRAPHHPYTARLVAAMPGRGKRHEAEEGSEPAGGGCPYAGRCPLVMEHCTQEPPPWREVGPGHRLRCWHDEAELRRRQTVSDGRTDSAASPPDGATPPELALRHIP